MANEFVGSMSFNIDQIAQAHREFIGPREPFGQEVRRRAAEAKAETLGYMAAWIEHHYDLETAVGVMKSFGVDL